MKILVTGSSGYLGENLINFLCEKKFIFETVLAAEDFITSSQSTICRIVSRIGSRTVAVLIRLCGSGP